MEKLIHNKDSVISYVDEGPSAALPVVFIHGFPLTKESWDGQAAALTADFRVIRYDLSGMGKSVSGDGVFTIDSHVEDLIKVMDDCSVPKAVIAGLSMGGYITLRAYEKYSDRFIGMVLSNTKAGADNNEGKIKRASQVASLKEKGVEPFATAFSNALFSEEYRSSHSKELSEMITLISRQQVKGIAGNLVALAARTDSTHVLETIQIPALIIHGEKDSIIKAEDSVAMKNSIRGSQMATITKAGHLANLENPEEYNNALISFLKSIG